MFVIWNCIRFVENKYGICLNTCVWYVDVSAYMCVISCICVSTVVVILHMCLHFGSCWQYCELRWRVYQLCLHHSFSYKLVRVRVKLYNYIYIFMRQSFIRSCFLAQYLRFPRNLFVVLAMNNARSTVDPCISVTDCVAFIEKAWRPPYVFRDSRQHM